MPATILIVDDEPLNLALLTGLLGPSYRTRAARSGPSALAMVARERPDLILLDVMMPEMDGYEVLRRLQADPASAGIPVIFVTALGAEVDEEHGLALGAVDYIVKPVKPALVLARVHTHLELKAARDRLIDANAWLEREVQRRMREALLAQELTLCTLAGMAEARDIALHHHEKWDGSGYPLGLAGPAIPLAARLMAVADVFDALTMRRVYKTRWTREAAIAHILEGRGRHFDPGVVDAFAHCLPQFEALAQRFAD